MLQERMGIPARIQTIIYVVKVLHDNYKLQDYNIGHYSTIFLNTRLLGGCPKASSKGITYFKDAVKRKMESQQQPYNHPTSPNPYIMKQMTQVPSLTINFPEVNEIHDEFISKVVICRVNALWPKSKALHQWIFSTWTTNCDIHLCSKDLFIVKFDTKKDKGGTMVLG